MLSASVHPVKRLFVKQTDKTVAKGGLFHNFHCELIMVGGDIGRRIYRGKLVLRGGNLVMLGFSEHAELPQLRVKLAHKSGYAGL